MDYGIDPDTNRIAWACVDKGVCIAVGTIQRRKSNGEFNRHYEESFDYLTRDIGVNSAKLWIENVFKSRNVGTVAKLGEVQGELLMMARTAGIPTPDTQRPYQQTWRKHTTKTPPKADHEEAEYALAASVMSKKHVPKEKRNALTPHEAAAVCIALYGNLVSTGMVAPPVLKQKKRSAKTKEKGDA